MVFNLIKCFNFFDLGTTENIPLLFGKIKETKISFCNFLTFVSCKTHFGYKYLRALITNKKFFAHIFWGQVSMSWLVMLCVKYGNMGCQIFKGGIQDQIDSRTKFNTQRQLLYFVNRQSGKKGQNLTFKVNFHCKNLSNFFQNMNFCAHILFSTFSANIKFENILCIF